MLGVLRPVIYLPSSLSMEDSGCILMHERFHIKRKDPLLKFVSWIALTVHWFNPLVWLAYDCFQKDMEMSCDEEVIRLSGTDIRSSYAESLLALSVRQNRFSAPLAFTEGNPRPRIANLTVRKNTKKTAGIIAVSVCVLLSIVFMMTRGKGKDTVTVTDAGNDGIGMYADMDFSYGRNVRMIQIVADEWYQGEQTEYPVVTMRAQAGSSAQSIRFSFNTNGNEISVVCTVNGYMETCSIPLRDTASDVSGQAFSSYEINEKTELILGGETSLAVLQMNSADGMHAFSVYSPVDGSVYAIALKAVCTGWDTYTPEDILYMDDDEVSEIAIWSAPGGSAEDVHNAADPQSFYKELRKHLTEISKISDEYGISKEDSEDIRYILDIRGAGNSVLTVMNCEGTPVLVNYSGKYAVNEEVYQFIEETYEEEKPAAGDLRIRPAEGETVMDAGYIAEQANVPGLDAGYDLCDAIALIRIKTIEGTDTYNEVTQQTTAPYTWGTFEVITPVRGELRPGVQYTFTRSGGIVPWMKYHQFMEAWSPESAEKSDRLMEETGTQTPAYVYFHKFDDIDIESGKTYLAMFENTEYQARRTDAWRIAWFEAGLREAQGGKVLNNTTGEWEDLAALISEMKK